MVAPDLTVDSAMTDMVIAVACTIRVVCSIVMIVRTAMIALTVMTESRMETSRRETNLMVTKPMGTNNMETNPMETNLMVNPMATDLTTEASVAAMTEVATKRETMDLSQETHMAAETIATSRRYNSNEYL